MIKRIVKLTFRTGEAETFQEIYAASKPKILQQPGCRHLELWRDVKNPQTFFTYSHWDDEDSLNTYRRSDFFRGVWPRTKAILAEKPEAWSVQIAD